MKYMGSKSRIANDILPIILKNRKPNQWYVEPFAGGMNMIDKVDGNRLANDKNKYLIEMFKGLLVDKNRPKTIPKELYAKARTEYNNGTNNEFDDFLIGWIGWMASYNGRFFDGGYSGHDCGKQHRDYIREQINNVESQINNLIGVEFRSGDYKDLDIPKNSIIYCDIPYKGTKQYATSKDFNYDEFWQWCREKTKENHKVYISEYNAPEDFEEIWSKNISNSLNPKNTYIAVEKLFIFKH